MVLTVRKQMWFDIYLQMNSQKGPSNKDYNQPQTTIINKN